MKIFFALIITISFARDLPAQSTPPQVLTATPAFWSVGTNASAQKEIVISFDKPMREGFSSWAGRNSITPQLDATPKVSEDRKTFTLPVHLQPGKVYVFGLNEKGICGVGFQDEKGATLPPTYLVFQTSGSLAPDDAPPRAISTIPGNGASRVDPARTRTISISFDKQMRPGKHGLHMRENQKEVDLSKARFQYSADGKSFTLGYDFKPAGTYEFELNSTRDIGFASKQRVPLWPVKVSFSTN